MINKLNKKRKKKGFTLIELVIVLAVLAIIALIAIPNFTKVRNDSLAKADARTMEQIEKITLMAIANEDITVPTTTGGEVKLEIQGASVTVTGGSGVKSDNFNEMIKEVEDPQVNGKEKYEVTVDANGDVTVTTTP